MCIISLVDLSCKAIASYWRTTLPGESCASLPSLFCLANDSKMFSSGVGVKVSASLINFALKAVGHLSKSLEAVSDPKRRVKS